MNQYGLLNCHFTVEWGGARIGVDEVLGLDIYVDVAKIRESSSPEYSPVKMPGLRRFNNITLKRMVVKGDNDFYKWLSTQKLNTIERRNLIISLLNEDHQPVVIWKVHNAFPVRYSGPALNANTTAHAMEELELAHEGLEVEND